MHIRKTVKNSLTDQREVNRTKTRKNMFFLILFGFYHVFLTGRTAAKNNIQFQPYRSDFFVRVQKKSNCTVGTFLGVHKMVMQLRNINCRSCFDESPCFQIIVYSFAKYDKPYVHEYLRNCPLRR